MRNLIWLLYTGLMLGANGAAAGAVDPALLVGDMAKLIAQEARPVPEVAVMDMADAPHGLADLRGKWVVLNFWATWCVPCRLEMPALDRLQVAMPQIVVVTVASGPNPIAAIERFLDEAGIKAVTVWRDPDAGLTHQMGVFGLPVTVIITPEGAEVARLIGGAEWDDAQSQAVLTALMAP